MATYVAFIRLNVRTAQPIDEKQLGRVLDTALEEGLIPDAILGLVLERFEEEAGETEVWGNVSSIVQDDRKR